MAALLDIRVFQKILGFLEIEDFESAFCRQKSNFRFGVMKRKVENVFERFDEDYLAHEVHFGMLFSE